MRLNKSLVKLVIMVKPYNASMINYIKDNYWKNQFKWDWWSLLQIKDNNNILLNSFDFLLYYFIEFT